MNPDLHIVNDLKAMGAGNRFVIFGEADTRDRDHLLVTAITPESEFGDDFLKGS